MCFGRICGRLHGLGLRVLCAILEGFLGYYIDSIWGFKMAMVG